MISEQELDKRINEIYNEVVDASTKPGDFEATKKLLEGFCLDNDAEHSGVWHYAAGMRDVRALDPNDERSPINLQDPIRGLACARCMLDVEGIWEEGDVELVQKYSGLSGCEVFTMPNGDWIYLDNMTVHEIIEDEDGNMQLHCDTGPAIAFSDGSALYALEDVTVPEWVVMTAVEDMDPAKVLAIEDVDVRMIALKKMGIDRCLEKAEKVANGGTYALYDFGELLGDKALYLDMVNATTGEHHLEGVDNDCTSVKEAMEFRAGGREWNPCQNDGVKVDGGNADQYQQGDVLIAACEFFPTDEAILETRELLSSANQRRHVAKGIKSLRGSDDRQYVVAKKTWAIEHPEHGQATIPAGRWEIWGVLEIDHVTGILRTVID